jgi:hypothetical protein
VEALKRPKVPLVLKVSQLYPNIWTSLTIYLVGNALVRYINSGVTLGSVNLAEITLRSLTLEERNHARVIFIHHNVPGVLRKGMSYWRGQ